MNDSTPPANVPVLTEVLTDVGAELPASGGVVLPLRGHLDVARPEQEPALAAPPDVDQDALVQEVLADVQRQINGLYAYRIRDSLNPLLDKLVQDLVGAAREELASTVHDIVRKAVAQALTRRRNQGASR